MNYEQKINAAQNPNTPTKTLELLATDKDFYVRCYVAQNPNTPTKTLELLATDKDFYVRCRVAQHPNRTQIVERLILMTESKLSTAAT